MATIRVVAVVTMLFAVVWDSVTVKKKELNSLTYVLNSLTSCTVEKSWVKRMSSIVMNGVLYESHSLQHKPLCPTV